MTRGNGLRTRHLPPRALHFPLHNWYKYQPRESSPCHVHGGVDCLYPSPVEAFSHYIHTKAGVNCRTRRPTVKAEQKSWSYHVSRKDQRQEKKSVWQKTHLKRIESPFPSLVRPQFSRESSEPPIISLYSSPQQHSWYAWAGACTHVWVQCKLKIYWVCASQLVKLVNVCVTWRENNKAEYSA